MVNVGNLKLYEPPMIMDPKENAQIPTVDDFSPECMTELQEDTILDRKVCTSRKGYVDYLRVGIKGMNPSKARWMEIRRVRELYFTSCLLKTKLLVVQKILVERNDL